MQFLSFQDLISALSNYWSDQGCVLMQALDLEVGAGTFHPETFLRALGSQPWRTAFVQPSRRPQDGRYGENPNRLQKYYQYQVILKPSPQDIQNTYLHSLKYLGIDPLVHDIRFVEDNWESPALGAWGLGWEVWCDGMEISQFTFFQQIGGLECQPITVEITYGLERLAMLLQGVDTVFDILWAPNVYYGAISFDGECQMSAYHFEHLPIQQFFQFFDFFEQEASRLLILKLILPAYECVLKTSHIFNLLDARGVISKTERQSYLLRLRSLSAAVAKAYTAS